MNTPERPTTMQEILESKPAKGLSLQKQFRLSSLKAELDKLDCSNRQSVQALKALSLELCLQRLMMEQFVNDHLIGGKNENP